MAFPSPPFTTMLPPLRKLDLAAAAPALLVLFPCRLLPVGGLLTLCRLRARRLSAWLARSRGVGEDDDDGLERLEFCCLC